MESNDSSRWNSKVSSHRRRVAPWRQMLRTPAWYGLSRTVPGKTLDSAVNSLVCLCHFCNRAWLFSIVTFDFGQMTGKQLSGDNTH